MTTQQIITIEKRIVALLFFVLVSLSLLYVYLINDTIFSVVERKENEEMIAVVETEISVLVSKYMNLAQSIDEERVSELNFTIIPENSIVAIERRENTTFSLLDNAF